MKLVNLKEQRGENILIYASPGSGKTHLACTVAKDKKTLLFDIDKGAKTVSNLPPEIIKNIVPIQYTTFKDLNEIGVSLY